MTPLIIVCGVEASGPGQSKTCRVRELDAAIKIIWDIVNTISNKKDAGDLILAEIAKVTKETLK